MRRAVASELGQLHTLAGWCYFDSDMPADTIRTHFARSIELATPAGDA
ncbi:hypothetical protein GCM10022222_42350 [Amycolatopsis ultiminotia]|uniref:Uncharacterized protein n=1 Tax=Amycolatopsis ultiminotia TaxID=543629 RepID=A0ABP6WNH2_9PSEU